MNHEDRYASLRKGMGLFFKPINLFKIIIPFADLSIIDQEDCDIVDKLSLTLSQISPGFYASAVQVF